MHAELTQLRLNGQGLRGIGRILEVTAYRIGLLGRQGLAQINAVGGDDLFQAVEFGHQLFRPRRPHRGNIQLGDQACQGGAGREFGAQFALVLQLQPTL
ncbi:hypothetical protein D3C79_886110 [compost metagenome]